MFKTGFVGNLPKTLCEAIIMHPGFEVTGCFYPLKNEHYQKINLFKKIPELSRETMLDINDVLIFCPADLYIMETIREALKQSRHIFLLDICQLPSESITELMKLQEEAQTIIQAKSIERSNPVLHATLPLILHPSLLEIKLMVPGKERDISTESVIRTILKMLDALLFLIPLNIKKIHSVRLPVSFSSATPISVRIEFDNGVVANLLSSGMAETESFTIDIYQKNHLLKIDLLRQRISTLDRDESNNRVNAKTMDFLNGDEHIIYNEVDKFYQAIMINNHSGNEFFEVFRLLELSRKIAEKAGFPELA